MLMSDISLKVETNDMSCLSNACAFEPYAKIGDTLFFIRDTGWWALVFSNHTDGWKASSNDRPLWVTIKNILDHYHQNHPLFPMPWGVVYRNITHLGGCALTHGSTILAEIWIKASVTASITATSERPLRLCLVPCPFQQWDLSTCH